MTFITTSAQDVINAYWSEQAPAYDAYQQRPERIELNRKAWERVWHDALPTAPADVLDVGTGSGHVAFTVAGLGHRVQAIDLAEGMLEIAHERAATTDNAPSFALGDAVAPDFPPASFDAVVGRYVMWTMREPAVAVGNWLELLRPGGTVAVVDSTWYREGDIDIYDERARAALPLAAAPTIERTAEYLAHGGLLDVSVTPLNSIYALDQKFGVAPDHSVQMQYLITGTAPR